MTHHFCKQCLSEKNKINRISYFFYHHLYNSGYKCTDVMANPNYKANLSPQRYFLDSINLFQIIFMSVKKHGLKKKKKSNAVLKCIRVQFPFTDSFRVIGPDQKK